MSTEPEHEIVPAIRAWLAATSDVEIPLGLSREDSRRRARELLAAIDSREIVSQDIKVNDELKDIFWASVEALDESPIGQPVFEECDRLYQFVAALPLENDSFGELDQVLHRVANIGWRSAPGGLENVLRTRTDIWDHGDEQRHQQVCADADRLPALIEALEEKQVLEPPEVRDICSQLTKLTDIRPSLVATLAVPLAAILNRQDHRIGWLDDREFLKAVTALAAGIAARHLGRLDAARTACIQAAAGFHRAADTLDLDRVDVEHLALEQVIGSHVTVVESAPALIRSLAIPRAKIKAQLILAQSLINLERPQDASAILEAVLANAALEKEPAYHAFLLTKLGTALSHVGKDAEAASAFNSAGAILKRFFHPTRLADLTGSIGEHLGRRGRLVEATALYLSARAEYQRTGQARFVGYYSVLVAELMMLRGKNREAEMELRTALPLIEKFELRKEAEAAVALLREAMKKRHTDLTTVQTLREQLRKGLH